MKKILVVDDHPIVLKGIVSMLADNGYSVLTATSREQAATLFGHVSDISLMVCDLSLPTTTDGIRLIEHVRSILPHVPVIVFTMHDELWNIRTIMDIGAEGIVLKGENPNELLLAIRDVLDGNTHISPKFKKMSNEVMAFDRYSQQEGDRDNKGNIVGLQSREIAEKMCISEKTIEFHRRSILHKLGSKTIAEATKRAIEMGILA